MRLGLSLGYWGLLPGDPLELAREADRLGYHSVWMAEAYGTDALTPLAWVAAQTERVGIGTAVLQMPARTPANTAMSAMTMDMLSGGRMHLGLGMSGPQVVEGWHGQPYDRPLARTREYVSIVRAILRREAPLDFHGTFYDIPYTGPRATGLGKPLKLIVKPVRSEIPVYLAAIGPKNVALAGEIADGWLPVFYSPHRPELLEPLFAGMAKAGRDRAAVDVAPTVSVAMGDDVAACCAALKPFIALYVGGMGARGRNFYNDLACRMGYEEAAQEIQDLYLEGKKAEAVAAVPDALVDEVSLCGPRERIADRLSTWREAGVTTLIAGTVQVEAIRALAEMLL